MSPVPFQVLITLEPLGLLYGSSGRLLSAETLTGRAAEHFPPDAPALAGLLASQLSRSEVRDLFSAGPFWQQADGELMLPAPLVLIPEEGGPTGRCSRQQRGWQEGTEDQPAGWWSPDPKVHPPKTSGDAWICLSDWPHPAINRSAASAIPLHGNPWQAVPHLHPKLLDEQRVSAQKDALFLEYGIALEPGVRLAYLSSHPIPEGVVRFGGEGHLAELRCHPLPALLQDLLRQPLTAPFALITPGLWGGPKLSIREPIDTTQPRGHFPWHRDGVAPAILTERPRPWRHRLGAGSVGKRRLSRGRWAVPAGSCYRVAGDPLPPWPDWPEPWFPKEGFSFKQFGTALALPLHPAP